MTTVSSLPSQVAVHPNVVSTAHETTFDLTVTSDPLAQAGSITYVDLELQVNNRVHLARIMRRLRGIATVRRVMRVTN